MAATRGHRQTQLALLHEACGRRTRATVERCSPCSGKTHAELLRLEPTRLVLFGHLTDPDEIGTPTLVEIGFPHEATWYSFRSEVLSDPAPTGETWAVAVPLRLIRRDARGQQRIGIPDSLPVTVRMTGMYAREQVNFGLLRNVSSGGLAVLCRQAPSATSQKGQPHWLEFALPGSPRQFAFAARLAYLQNLPDGSVLQGWSFYASDDNAAYLEQLQEISRILEEALGDGVIAETSR